MMVTAEVRDWVVRFMSLGFKEPKSRQFCNIRDIFRTYFENLHTFLNHQINPLNYTYH